MAARKVDVGTGVAIAITGTQGGTIGGTELIDVQWSGITRGSIDSTHLGTTVSAGTALLFGSKTFIAERLTDPGELTFTFHFDPDLSIPPVEDDSAAIVITWEEGGTWSATGFCTSFTLNGVTNEDKMTCDATYKLTGGVIIVLKA